MRVTMSTRAEARAASAAPATWTSVRADPRRDARHLSGAPAECAGPRLHPRRLLADAVVEGVQLRRARAVAARRHHGRRQLRALRRGHRSTRSPARCRAAVAWDLRNIDRHGGDPERVIVGGHSAGGHLTAMCLQTDWADDYGLPDDPIAGAVLGQRPLRPAAAAVQLMQPQLQIDDGVIRRKLADVQRPARARRRLLVTWGGDEPAEFRRQSDDFLAAWQAAATRAFDAAARAQPLRLRSTASRTPKSAAVPIYRLMCLEPRAAPWRDRAGLCAAMTAHGGTDAVHGPHQVVRRGPRRATSIASTSTRARSSASSGRTVPARRRCSGCWPATSRPRPARSCSAARTSPHCPPTTARAAASPAPTRCRGRSRR